MDFLGLVFLIYEVVNISCGNENKVCVREFFVCLEVMMSKMVCIDDGF